MKTSPLLPLCAGFFLAGFVHQAAASPAVASDNVTVIFHDPDSFSDVRENQSDFTSAYYLDVLKAHLQQTALPLLAPGQKLTITISDIDLAGETRLGRMDNIRVIKDVFLPRVALKFQLVGPDGKVVKEGERKLTDLNFNSKLRLPGFNEPLFYDKELLKDWLLAEFRTKA